MRRRWVLPALLGVLVAALVGVSLLGWSALRSVADLRSSVAELRVSVAEGRLGDARQDLSAAAESAQRLKSLTPGPLQGIVKAMPIIGTQATAALAVGEAAIALDAAAGPLLDYASRLQNGGLRTDDDRIDVAVVSDAAPLLTQASQGLEEASTILAPVASRDSAEASEIADAIPLLERGAQLTQRAAQASTYLPAMLGADGPRTYAVLLQNTAEMRGSGGLLGAYALVTVDDGAVTLDEAAARKDGLDDDSIPYLDVADEGQIATWGSDLGEWSTYNLSLDFPLTAKLTEAGMSQRGTPVDGVIALDARIVAALLAGTGPIEEGGARLTFDDADDFFTRDIYAKVPEVNAKDDLTVLLLRSTLDAALNEPLDLVALAQALVDPVSEGRLRMWSSDPAEEQWLLTTPLGGGLPDEPGPFIGVALNNAAGSKLDAYVTLDAHYRVGGCAAQPDQRSTLELLLGNEAPTGLPDYVTIRLDRPDAPEGSTSLLVHVYGPEGASLLWARQDGEGTTFTSTKEDGHPVWGFDVDLERDQQVRLRLGIKEPTVEGAKASMALPPLAEEPGSRITQRPCPAK